MDAIPKLTPNQLLDEVESADHIRMSTFRYGIVDLDAWIDSFKSIGTLAELNTLNENERTYTEPKEK